MQSQKQSLQQVNNFGLHLDEELAVWWLIEQRQTRNFTGLLNNSCPFVPRTGLNYCPHNILFGDYKGQYETYLELLAKYDELKFFDPLFKVQNHLAQSVMFIDNKSHRMYSIVHRLQCMSWMPSDYSLPSGANADPLAYIFSRATRSNLSLMVYYNVNTKEDYLIDQFAGMSAALCGRVVFIGERQILHYLDPECCQTIENIPEEVTQFFNALTIPQIKALGAKRIKDFMKGINVATTA